MNKKNPLQAEEKEIDEIVQPEEAPVKGKVIFSKAWLIVCGVLLFLIIAASIVLAFLPE